MTTSDHDRHLRENGLVDDAARDPAGEVIDRPPRYDEARRVWNGLIDRRPAVIARCAGTADVVEAVRVARAHRPVGQHPRRRAPGRRQRRLRRRPGDRPLGDEGRARRPDGPHGPGPGRRDLGATSTGRPSCSGWSRRAARCPRPGSPGSPSAAAWVCCMRAHGLSCDNLRSVEIVTADGAVRTASREEHPDLFWAARGGGRGLGVVTSFEFDLHPLGPRGRHGAGALPLRRRRARCCARGATSPRSCPTPSRRSSCCGASRPTRRSRRRCTGRRSSWSRACTPARPATPRRRWPRWPGSAPRCWTSAATVDYLDAAERGSTRRSRRWPVLLQVPLPGRR